MAKQEIKKGNECINKLYAYKNCTTSEKRDELLEFLLAVIPMDVAKEAVKYFKIK